MKPMLAGEADLNKLKFPLFASPKLDGIRGVVVEDALKSRSLKPIPNPHVSARFSLRRYNGLDGELILGSSTAKDVYRVTNGACARKHGTPDVKFHVFDFYNSRLPFEKRVEDIEQFAGDKHIVVVPHKLIKDLDSLLLHEQECLNLGYEGLILRAPDGPYKFGRSTTNEGWMLKLKRFVDREAEIIGVYEEMENTNAKQTNELGRGQRSTAAAGLVPKGRAGGLEVRDVETGVEFRIGTGLNDDDRAYFWKHQKSVQGKLVKYKSFLIGVKDLPRHPVYLGGREAWDL
jgi:DNA ligase 1